MCFSGLTPSTPRKLLALLSAGALVLGLNTSVAIPALAQNVSTSTPIKHVVVIFQENVSFDHYFATYPVAQNPAGDPQFHASRSTPSINGLNNAGLRSLNPNSRRFAGRGVSGADRSSELQLCHALNRRSHALYSRHFGPRNRRRPPTHFAWEDRKR